MPDGEKLYRPNPEHRGWEWNPQAPQPLPCAAQAGARVRRVPSKPVNSDSFLPQTNKEGKG